MVVGVAVATLVRDPSGHGGAGCRPRAWQPATRQPVAVLAAQLAQLSEDASHARPAHPVACMIFRLS